MLYLDSRERGALTSATIQAALETLSAQRRGSYRDRERLRLYREAMDKARKNRPGTAGRRRHPAIDAARGASRRQVPQGHRGVGRVPIRQRSDFFDYIDLSTGASGFILGDVSSKGSPAALLASATVLGMFSAEAMYHNEFRRADHTRECGLVRGARSPPSS